MNYSILIKSAPFSQQGALTAYHFCCAALQLNHHITHIFFYQDGVHNASALTAPPPDELDLVSCWQALAQQHGIELLVCSGAASRRGVLDDTYAKRYEKAVANCAQDFKIVGLGQWVEASTQADRCLVFGG